MGIRLLTCVFLACGVSFQALAMPSTAIDRTKAKAETPQSPPVAVPRPAPPPPASAQTPAPPRPPLKGKAAYAEQIEGTITDEDYPPAAQRKGESGLTVVRFLIDAKGSVSQCEIAESSGSPTLDGQSCGIVIARFRFTPGRDRSGKAVTERRTQRIHWQLPDVEPDDFSGDAGLLGSPPFHFVIEAIAQADGRLTDCKITGRGPEGMPHAEQVCDGERRVPPHKDVNGKPAAKRVRFEASLSASDIAPTPKPPKKE